MKRWILLVIVVLTLMAGAVCCQRVASPHWWQATLLKTLNNRWDGVLVRDVVIKAVDVDYVKGNIVFHQAQIKVKLKGVAYFISTNDVVISGLYHWFLTDSIFNIEILKTAIVSGTLNVVNIDGNGKIILTKHQFDRYEGNFTLQRLELNQLQVTEIKGSVSGGVDHLKVSGLKGKFYQGVLAGDMMLGMSKDSTLSVNGNFDHIDLESLGVINPSVLGKMKGKVQGQVQVAMQSGKVRTFRGRVMAPEGGVMKASLLRYLVQYIPQRQYIEALIVQDADIPLNQAQMETLSVNDEKFASQIKLFSSQLNVDLNIILDLNLEGGLKTLLRKIL